MPRVKVRYMMDNRLGRGFGGLMMSPGVKVMSRMMATRIAMRIALHVRLAEAQALGHSIQPGAITQAFSKLDVETFPKTIMHFGHANRRWAGRVSVTGSAPRPYGPLTQSSPVTYEFGSKFNEGTRSDRPRLAPMAEATKSWVMGNFKTRAKTHVGDVYNGTFGGRG